MKLHHDTGEGLVYHFCIDPNCRNKKNDSNIEYNIERQCWLNRKLWTSCKEIGMRRITNFRG